MSAAGEERLVALIIAEGCLTQSPMLFVHLILTRCLSAEPTEWSRFRTLVCVRRSSRRFFDGTDQPHRRIRFRPSVVDMTRHLNSRAFARIFAVSGCDHVGNRGRCERPGASCESPVFGNSSAASSLIPSSSESSMISTLRFIALWAPKPTAATTSAITTITRSRGKNANHEAGRSGGGELLIQCSYEERGQSAQWLDTARISVIGDGRNDLE